MVNEGRTCKDGAAASNLKQAGPYWTRDRTNQVRLLASLEIDFGKYFFPPIPPQSPLAGRFRIVELSPTATLYSFTVIYPNPKTGKTPFTLVYADFPEQVRVLGRLKLTDGMRPVIGSRLRVQVEDFPDGESQYVFVCCD